MWPEFSNDWSTGGSPPLIVSNSKDLEIKIVSWEPNGRNMLTSTQNNIMDWKIYGGDSL